MKKSNPSNSAKKPQRKSLPRLPSQETGMLDDTSSSSPARQLKNTKPIAGSAQVTQSATGQLQGTEMKPDSIQGPIQAGANPDEQIAV